MTSLLASRPRVDRSFERLYRRHVADVYHYALGVLRNANDAEDVTQTTFLNAYSAYRRGERPRSPRNWLIAIAHNVCRQRFRQSARRPQEIPLDEDVGEALVDDDGPSAHDIRKALGHLAFNQRAALVMRELEGRSYAEIGEILGLSVAAVETLIFRARRALREQLEGSLTCRQAELAVSRQMDGRLPRAERGTLRAHLRECPECATFARRQRAQRAAVRSIAAIPLPASLASFFGGGGAVTTGVAAKAVAVVSVGALVGGAGYEGVKRLPARHQTASAVQPRPAVRGPAAAMPASARVMSAEPARARTPAVATVAEGATPAARRRGRGFGKALTKRIGKRVKSTPGRTWAAPPGGSKTRGAGGSGTAHSLARTPPGQAKKAQKPAKEAKAGAGRPETAGRSDPNGQAKKTLSATPPSQPGPPQPPPGHGGKK